MKLNKPLSEKELFAACGVDPERLYRVKERIAICCGTGPVTVEALTMAKDDLERFDREVYLASWPEGKR